MSEKFILNEWYELVVDPAIIKEAVESPNSPLVLKEKLLQKAETKNANGRIYPRELLEREINRYSQYVKTRRAIGELDHPDSPIVELKNAAILITEIRMDGLDVLGDVEILNTPNGKILRDLVTQKVRVGISSRGLGSLKKESTLDVVQDDFELVAFDAVSSPSTPGAYLVSESVYLSKIDRFNDLRNTLLEILGDQYFRK